MDKRRLAGGDGGRVACRRRVLLGDEPACESGAGSHLEGSRTVAMHTAVSIRLAGPRPGCNGFLAPRGVMGSAVRLATDSPSRGGIDDAAGQKDCSCPKDSWPTGCDRKQGLPRRLRTGVGTVAVYPLDTQVRGTPTMPTRPTSWFYRMGEPGDPAAFYLIVVGDHRRRPRGRRRCKTNSAQNPEPCRPTDRDNRSDGWSLVGTGPLSDGPARRAEVISGKTTVIVRWRSRDEAEDHAVPHGRTGVGLLHADRLRHAVRNHPRLSRMPPVATDDKLRGRLPGCRYARTHPTARKRMVQTLLKASLRGEAWVMQRVWAAGEA